MLASPRLSRKVLLGLGAGLGLSSLAFLAVIVGTYRERLSSERGNASVQVNRLLQVSLENAMLKRDLPGLQDIVTRLGQQPGITGVRIVNPDRKVRFSSDPGDLNKVLSHAELGCAQCADQAGAVLAPSTQLIRDVGGKEVLRSVNPIANKEPCKECHGEARDHPINGILVVDHEGHGIRAEALQAAAAMSGAGLLVTLLGLGTVWLVLRRQVLSPIYALDETSRAIAQGRLDRRVELPQARDDELVDLCRSFNAMAEKIEQGVNEVREKEAFLKALIDTVPDGVRVIDEDYTVIMANSAYARQIGMDERQLVNAPCYAVKGRSERCPPTLVTCPFDALSGEGQSIKYIHRYLRADASEVHVETTAASLMTCKDGKPRRLIVEAMRNLEQQVKYSHEQRLSEIGQLAAGVAHEIYNPLASVRLGLQAILRNAKKADGGSAELHDYLGLVDGEVEKCIRITKRLLDLSQTPSQSIQLVSFSNIVPEVVSLMHFEAEQKGVRLHIDIGQEDLRVFATDAELRMLVLNLAQNAFHAMPQGGDLHIQGRQDANCVVLEFKDTGTGIAADVLPNIFDPFYSKRADGVPGTGLGLTICKAIVTRYKGTIGACSEPGLGTRFTITFPRADTSKALS